MRLDDRPYRPAEAGDHNGYVFKVVADYVQRYLEPYTEDNIRYILAQMKWPLLGIEGRNDTAEAYHREMLRVLRLRVENVLPRARRMFEPRINNNLRQQIVQEQVADDLADAEENDEVLEWLFEDLEYNEGDFPDRFQDFED